MYQKLFTREAEPGFEFTLLDLNPNSLQIKGLFTVNCRLGTRIRQRTWMYGFVTVAVGPLLCLDIR